MWMVSVGLLALTKVVLSEYVAVTSFDLMKCTYGERGSLTATCVNATPSFFKSTLYKFDNLDETLRCLNCTLKTVDSGTFDLSGNQVKILDLRKSQIETLKTKAFMGLIFLEVLDLSDNKIRSIFPGTFTGVKKIKKVNLSKNHISILSEDGFLELIQLEELNLSENNIKLVDKNAFHGLKNLKVLNLNMNFLTDLPETVFQNVTYLQTLRLDHNELTTLKGPEFAELDKLLELDLSNNQLLEISSFIFTRPNSLTILNLSNNRINNLNEGSFQHLKALEELYLNKNQIPEIQIKTFHSLWNLHILDLSSNNLVEIKTGPFTGLPQLKALNCSFNTIKNVVIVGVFSLHSLHTLDLSHNNITELDYTALLNRMPKLSYLKLEDNNLPCDLESEMESYFSESNFKFVLYDNEVGSPKCVEVAPKKPLQLRIQTATDHSDISVASIFIYLVLATLVISVAVLFYLQYKLFFKFYKHGISSSTSVQYLTGFSSKEDIHS